MNCPHCHEPLPQDAAFCVYCGADLREYVESQDAWQQPVEERPASWGADVGGSPSTASRPFGHQVASRPQGSVSGQPSSGRLVLALALCCVMLAGALGFAVIRLLGSRSGNGGDSGQGSSAGQAQGDVAIISPDNQQEGGTGSFGSSEGDDNGAGTSQTAPGAAATEAPHLRVRDALADYSWEELSQIGDEIAAAPSRSDALAIAADYNLVYVDGSMRGDAKELNLGLLGVMRMRLVDVYHDEADTPSGRAGLTFIASSSSLSHRMAAKTIQEGGWESSEMRAFLRSDVWNALPAEVRDNVVPVVKMSNNHGVTSDAGVCTATWETLWLPSIMELAGEVDWTYHTHPELRSVYNAIFASEGYQYALFSRVGIDCWNGNPILVMPEGTYWMRSISPSTARGRYVDVNGDPSCFDDANGSRMVALGFCL